MVRELTGRQRNRLFVYDAYVLLLNDGTEPFRVTPGAKIK